MSLDLLRDIVISVVESYAQFFSGLADFLAYVLKNLLKFFGLVEIGSNESIDRM